MRRASFGVTLAWALAVGVTLGTLAQESAEDDELPWQALNREGMLAAAAADWPTAEAAFRAALEALADEGSAGLPALDKVDDDDGRVAAVAGNLAVVLLQQDETDEARRLFEQALAIRRSVFGARDPAIADSLNNLAELERRTGRLERARTLHEAALRLRREVLDEGHLDIAESLNNLGVLLRDLGDIEAAAAHLGEAHGIRRERLGPTHQATLESTGNLAAVALDMGDLATADSVLLAAIEALPVAAAASGGSPAFILRQGIDVLLLEDETGLHSCARSASSSPWRRPATTGQRPTAGRIRPWRIWSWRSLSRRARGRLPRPAARFGRKHSSSSISSAWQQPRMRRRRSRPSCAGDSPRRRSWQATWRRQRRI